MILQKDLRENVVLSKIVNLEIIHICRDFSGVLNSAKKSYKKDIKAGYEEELLPRKTSKTFLDWILNNILTVVFSIGNKSLKIHYKDYVNNIELLSNVISKPWEVEKMNSFEPRHLLAGNVIRLKDDIRLNPEIGFQYKRLSKRQLQFARFVDRIFFFWVKR